jgi:hypothetical protein
MSAASFDRLILSIDPFRITMLLGPGLSTQGFERMASRDKFKFNHGTIVMDIIDAYGKALLLLDVVVDHGPRTVQSCDP